MVYAEVGMTDLDHRVVIPLRSTDFWNIEAAVEEIKTIRDWLDEATDWQPDRYSMRIAVDKRQLDVWFHDEKIAILCILRWL